MADGRDYVATVDITTKDGALIAAAGEVCDAVDPNALGWLEACGAIAPVPVPAPTPSAPAPLDEV